MLENHVGMKLSRRSQHVLLCAIEWLIGQHVVMYADFNLLFINLPISVRSLGISKLVIFTLFPSFLFSTDFHFDIS